MVLRKASLLVMWANLILIQQERNEAYVVQLEIQLSKMLNIDGSRSDEDNLT